MESSCDDVYPAGLFIFVSIYYRVGEIRVLVQRSNDRSSVGVASVLGRNFLDNGVGPVNIGLLCLPSGSAEPLTRVIKPNIAVSIS